MFLPVCTKRRFINGSKRRPDSFRKKNFRGFVGKNLVSVSLDTVSSNRKRREIQSYASVNRTIDLDDERLSSFQHFAPAPGEYDVQMTDIDVNRSFIRSPFLSSTDRFYMRPKNVPGPGTYEKLKNFPSLRQIHRYSARGVYFDGNFH